MATLPNSNLADIPLAMPRSGSDVLSTRALNRATLERQMLLERLCRGYFGKRMADIDRAELLERGRALLADAPRTVTELRTLLLERWPDGDPDALGFSLQLLLPLVHVPPRGTWGRGGAVPATLAEPWLRRPLSDDRSPDELIVRYLGGFGPATVADVQEWSGLTRLKTAMERLRPQLRTFRDEAGKELFDLPDAPLPDPDTPAPPRFLPEYDNIVLGHADRTRMVPGDAVWKWEFPDTAFRSPLLVDGFVQAAWHLKRDRDSATLVVEPLALLPDLAAVEEEATRLLEFLAPEVGRRTIEIATR